MPAPPAERGVFRHQDIRHESHRDPHRDTRQDPHRDRHQDQHQDVDQDPHHEVVADAQLGDSEAFRTLYDTHAPRLLGYLRALVGDGDAEDVASETWARIHAGLPTYRRHRGDFRAWSTAIARNQAISHLRYRSSHHAVPMPPELLPGGPSRAPAEHDASEALGTERTLALLRDLPRTQARAVLLCVVIGMDAVMAARILRKQPSAVRMAVHRGLKALRQRIE